MKRFANRFLAILFAVLMVAPCVEAQHQQIPPIPVDPNVRIGKLDNGLTYYIRHNEYPKGLADFYIAQNVGAIRNRTISAVLPTSLCICALTELKLSRQQHYFMA